MEAPSPLTPVQDRPVRLTIPADPRMIGLLRLCIATVAAGASARIDEIDDLRMAVTEACQWLVPAARGGLIELTIHCTSAGIEASVTASLVQPDGRGAEPSDLSRTILKSTVDDFDLVTDPVHPSCAFVKKWQIVP